MRIHYKSAWVKLRFFSSREPTVCTLQEVDDHDQNRKFDVNDENSVFPDNSSFQRQK